MPRLSPALCLSALSLLVFSIAPAPAQTPDTTQTAPAADVSTQRSTQKPSRARSDASGLALLGAVVGGAALMDGSHGSDGSSSGSSDSSFAQSATAPAVIYTQPTPHMATETAAAAAVVISNPAPAIVSLPAPTETDALPAPVNAAAPSNPVVTVTYPTTVSVPSVAIPLVFSSQPTEPQTPTIAPRSSLPLPTPSVPEPGSTATLALGSLLLGGLGLRARRNARG